MVPGTLADAVELVFRSALTQAVYTDGEATYRPGSVPSLSFSASPCSSGHSESLVSPASVTLSSV